jgi:DinB family protein
MNKLNNDDWNEDLAFISRTPDTLRTVVAALHGHERRRAVEDEFSALEQVCHLRDIEAEGFMVRIDRLLREQSPHLYDLDGARLAVEREYNDQNLDAALKSFVNARTLSVEMLNGVSDEQKDRRGHLEHVGEVSLRQLLSMMRDHDQDHLEQLNNSRKRLLTG